MTPRPQYFFIIGAMKAGTTSLYKYLEGHPELYASPKKEPRVFRQDDAPDRLRKRLLALFEGRTAERWCFEASTAYTKYPSVSGVPNRLHAVVPDARLVYLVRNPVDRAWSHYLHNLAHGRESRPFHRVLASRLEYMDVSRYHLQLTQYLEAFPRERVLVQVFEDMVRDPDRTVRETCEFLGVDSTYRAAAREVAFNASSEKLAAPPALRMIRRLGAEEVVPGRVHRWIKVRAKPLPSRATLTSEVRAQMRDELRNDIEDFFSLIGRRIDSWDDFA